ncbi:MAG: hypothetical protein Q7T00_05275 [Rugosibacter sp.]|jgi:hypothetical protein|nr:hypothetical protein [Rugosibacter sp.]MDO9273588.1 hypothetical protein [Rugosibacter sp.]
MNEQSIPEQPMGITEDTAEKSAESVVDVPLQSPVKRTVRRAVEKTIVPKIDTVLDVSDKVKAPSEATDEAGYKATTEVMSEKLADSPVPETNATEEPAPFVPGLSTPDPVPVVRATPPAEFKPATPPLPDPRRRLRELLAIPDRDRTDALWDELIELEIQLAPGNRVQSPNVDLNVGRHQKPSRFAEPGRRPASSPNAGRHHRPNGTHGAHGSVPNAGPGGPGAAAPHGAGGADTPRPAKRFFKKPRRGPRPPDKI